MRFLSTRIHAFIDYISAVSFVALPWIAGFNDVIAATWIVIAVGFMILTMSLFTNYEGGIMAAVPMKIHLIVDIITGITVACSPWLFGFSDKVYLPFLIFGLFEALAALATSPDSKAALPENLDEQKVV
ncbi:hypothetical protein L0657_22380 [Dyadobacter sp. CY345]|uniref:SPW repeat domain-containing protein n=1 Tax=Dyadobacter sp. CY345 TaxID=2909335 RepID=UPI001F46AD20|nr:hypothetical protein [Dyadobacter sp. CY345]MCF2446721.1 hypothetical protein [Dyadobacter sp. CY345]